MKKLSKLLAVFVALAMCLTLLPMSALAAEAKAGERYSCGLAEHQHDDKCGDKEYKCTGHMHGPDCYTDNPICGKAEHKHHWFCCARNLFNRICGQERHVHSESCGWNEESGYQCGRQYHTHTLDCYATFTWACSKEAHSHSDSCYASGPVCGEAAHVHNASCPFVWTDRKSVV